MQIPCLKSTLRSCRAMLLNKPLNEQNFMSYAMKMYDNPHCSSVDEFEEDLNRIKYIKRLLNKYEEKDILRGRLLLNHIIILANVFGPTATNRILFHKIEKDLHSHLKSVLSFLNLLAERIPETELEKIPTNPKITKILGEIG